MTRVENYLDALVNMEECPDYPKVTRTRVENYLDAICKNAGRRKSMPTAGSEYRGKIIQYVGESDGTYTKGYFYVCNEEGSGTYSWSQIDVQPSGGGSTGGKIFTIATAKSNINSSDTEDYKTLCDFFLSVCKGEGPVLSFYLDKDSYASNLSSKYGILSAKNIDLQDNYYYIRVEGISSTTHRSSNLYYGCSYSQYAAYSYLVDGGSNHDFYISKAEVDNGEVTHIYSVNSSHLATNIHLDGYDERVLKASMRGYPLGIDNTTDYTPTGDYNPATKKYVDDAVGNIDTLLANLISGGGAE